VLVFHLSHLTAWHLSISTHLPPQLLNSSTPQLLFSHSITNCICYPIQVIGAASAGWTPLRFNEWFDNDFPDWLEIDSKEDALAGNEHDGNRDVD
jgi:hypothetical protein